MPLSYRDPHIYLLQHHQSAHGRGWVELPPRLNNTMHDISWPDHSLYACNGFILRGRLSDLGCETNAKNNHEPEQLRCSCLAKLWHFIINLAALFGSTMPVTHQIVSVAATQPACHTYSGRPSLESWAFELCHQCPTP